MKVPVDSPQLHHCQSFWLLEGWIKSSLVACVCTGVEFKEWYDSSVTWLNYSQPFRFVTNLTLRLMVPSLHSAVALTSIRDTMVWPYLHQGWVVSSMCTALMSMLGKNEVPGLGCILLLMIWCWDVTPFNASLAQVVEIFSCPPYKEQGD